MEGLNVTHKLPGFAAPPSFKGTSDPGVVGPSIISPWGLFDHLWSVVMGYSANDFEFVPGETPMSTLKETTMFIATYYLVVLGGRELMRSRPAFKLNTLFIIHNFYLTAISGALLVLFIQQLAPAIYRNGLYDGICGGSGWTQPLVVLYYLNYLTKYLELLDTVFLVLKKKPLTFLHTYHHGATALLCYTQLIGHTSVSWVPITLNLTVHVVMYWYYFQSARGIRIWWKKYITLLQISQFIIDLGVVYFASWDYFASTHAPSLPHVGTCAGEPYAAVAGCVILSSYLVLFIGFYFTTYKKSERTARKGLHRAEKTEIPTVPETTEAATEVLNNAKDVIVDAVNDQKRKNRL